MLSSRMGIGLAAVIGLLCVAHQAQANCEYESRLTYYDIVTCTGSADCTDLLYPGYKNYVCVQLTKVTDIAATIKKLKALNEENPIKKIVLSDSNITTVPSELLAFGELTYLDISSNNISSINLNILSYAKHLISLNVSHNGIEEFETESTTYISAKNLEVIDLSHNKLVRVPVNCFYSSRDSLENLDLSHNQISTFDFFAFSSLVSLNTLRLSHNKIVNFGFILYPMNNLRNLYLDNNLIKEINAEVFAQSKSLMTLDLSSNDIEMIEDLSFGSLKNLGFLNFSRNSITSIKEIMFRNNTQLTTLDLSFNNLSNIEPGTFSSMENFIDIGLERAFAMPIQEHVLAGVKASHLNFAGGKINKIEDRPFISMSSSLLSLNLSSSAIHEVSETALDSLTELLILDLSNNQLSEIAFETNDLKKLMKLDIHNNSIREIKPKNFEYLISLQELDLSYNDIQTIPAMAFKNLKNLEMFKIAHNKLDSTMLSNTFYGLEKVIQLELINTKVQIWESYAFSGLKSLKVLNASHGQLTYIDYYTFTETGNIEILDLSNNQIQNFNVKLLPNSKLKEVYLNNNRLGSFSKKIFEGLEVLEILDLSNNNLYTVETSAFSALKSLTFLDLSHNPDLKLGGSVFEGLGQLDTVILKNISKQITFESENVAMQNLDISSSQISNVSLLQIHNIKKLYKLDLGHNNITTLDQFSFGDLMHLDYFTWLNLGHNNLEYVNPGTFLKTKSILYLDLSHNKLDRVQFGALSGLKNLRWLNLSNNLLPTFKMTLLFDIPSVSMILLDNNKISTIGLRHNKYNLNKLSVGGNDLACDDLIDLKVHYDFVTAESLYYFTENVDGIPCTSFTIIDVGPNPRFAIS